MTWRILIRFFVASMLAVLLAAAWWWPAPSLVRYAPVDWARQYERANAPRPLWGATEYAAELIRTESAVPPFTEFVAREVAERRIDVGDEALAASLQGLAGGAVYRSPAERPGPVSGGYVEIETNDRILHFFATPLSPAEYFGQQPPIPSATRYPARAWSWFFAAAGLLWVAVVVLSRDRRALARCSSAGGMRVFGSLAAVGLLAALTLSAYGAAAIGVGLLGMFVALLGIVGVVLFTRELRIAERLLDGTDRLGHWVVAGEPWRRFAESVRSESRGTAWRMVLVINAISTVVCAGFALLVGDEASRWTAITVFLGILGLTLFLAWWAPRLVAKRYSGDRAEVYVGRRGAWLNGGVWSWGDYLSRLEGAALVDGDSGGLEISYSSMASAGGGHVPYLYRLPQSVRLPLPPAGETGARSIVDELSRGSGSRA